MWIYLTGNDGLPPIILYDYQPGRAGDYAKNFLEGFSGLLECDGYTGYNRVENVTLVQHCVINGEFCTCYFCQFCVVVNQRCHRIASFLRLVLTKISGTLFTIIYAMLVCCLAHCRRHFFEAVPAARRKKVKLLDINSPEEVPEEAADPEKAKEGNRTPAEVGLCYCNQLFRIERILKTLSAQERKEKRMELEVPVWDRFWSWLVTVKPLGGSLLEKAVNYAANHRELLGNYLLDGRREISNNRAVRCTRVMDTETETPENRGQIPI